MDVHQILLFFFSSIGAFNGLIIGLFFIFYVKPKHTSNLFLGLLLLALSVRVGKSVFFYFNDNLADVYIQIGLFACWFIGPLLYFYVKTTLEDKFNLPRHTKWHFIPLVLTAGAIFYFFPRQQYEKLWYHFFIYLIYALWFLYVVLAINTSWKNRVQLQNAQKRKSSFILWFFSILVGNIVICLAYVTGNYTSYIVGALSFSFVFYLLILLLLFAKKRKELLFIHPPRTSDKRIGEEEAHRLIQQLEDLMTEQELFTDANLTLTQVAGQLKILPAKLSLLLNDNMESSFSKYLNTKRIAAAQQMILSSKKYSLEAIGYDCGFNSKSAFYAAFKKYTGTTPSQYRERGA